MAFYTDQLNKVIELKETPKRIVSLVPSQTELLFDLGLNEEVIGITKFCVHPQEWFTTKTRIGGTKNINIERIKQLQPDLIIANKEENVKEQIEALENIGPVWISDVNNLEDALKMIEKIGEIIGKKQNAESLTQNIQHKFSQLTTHSLPLKTCYLIWQEPYMTIGGDTFINGMMKRCGLINVFENETRYPTITLQEIEKRNCELILLSSEPYPFQEKHVEEIQSQILNKKLEIKLVDGEMFSWYGSRLLKAADYFIDLLTKIKL
jgi:ABC-type Fe3+-hydroxamate transport system substrate-binding protein